MGSVCGSNMTSTLIKQYGNDTILQYAQSMIGSNLISQQGSSLRNLITQKFNSSPQAGNAGLLDGILGQIQNTENA